MLVLAAGCATGPGNVSRARINANTPFTMAVLHMSRLDVPPQMTGGNTELFSEPMVKKAGDRYAIVRCLVDPGGTTRDVQCVESSDAGSARAAVSLVFRCRFVHPRPQNGKPVAVKVEYGIVFHPERGGLVAGSRYDDHLGSRYDDHLEPPRSAEQVPITPATSGPFPNTTYTPQGGGM